MNYGGKFSATCPCCKSSMIFTDWHDIDCIYCEGKYYHNNCFNVTLEKKMRSKNSLTKEKWESHANEIPFLKKITMDRVENNILHDELYKLLCTEYDLISLSTYLLKQITEVITGERKGMVRGIPLYELVDMWKHYLSYLKKSRVINSSKGKEIFGEQLIRYELAILIGKYSEYKRDMSSIKQLEVKNDEEPIISIANVKKKKENVKATQDVVDLLDDIFGVM